MDLSKELEKMKNSSKLEIIENLEADQEILNQKIHIMKILDFAEEIENMMNEGKFENATTLLITNVVQPNKVVFIYCFMDNQDNEINLEDWKIGVKIYNYFENIKHHNYISEDFLDKTINIELVPGIQEKLKDVLLSNNFKKALMYSHLENSTNDNNVVVKNKHKV